MPNTRMIFPVQPVYQTKIDVVWADKNYPRKWGIHTGWDINGKGGGNTDFGMPFNCIYPGEVVFATDDAGGAWGGLIVVWHRSLNIFTRYAHHRPESCFVRIGQSVDSGTMLAEIGRGKNNMYLAHLHFDILREIPMLSKSGFRPHWAYWPLNDKGGLLRYFLDPTRVFDKFGVLTPKIPNQDRQFGDSLGLYESDA